MKQKPLLLEECGVTADSMHNTRQLIASYGLPDKLDFQANTKAGDYFITGTWRIAAIPSYQHIFTGFAWGYGGTGPCGLRDALALMNCDVKVDELPIDKYGKTDCSWERKAV